ncbi:MAG: DsbA family protein [Candidatus Woesearchaeota archaeon]
MSLKRSEMSKTHTSADQYFNKSSGDSKTLKLVLAVLGILLVVSVFTGGFNVGLTGNFIANMLPSRSDFEGGGNEAKESSFLGEKVELEFYVMSQCPYGVQVENSIAPVLEKMGEGVDFKLDFIGTDLGDGNFQSLHGEPEVLGNKVQLCAIEYNPDKYMDMIKCMNQNAAQIPDNWESCAEDSGLDVESIRSCYESEEGDDLLRESFARAQERQATGSPTIFLNGESYSGGRAEMDFMRALCNAFEGEKPEACDEIPEPVAVDVIILNDKECKSCPTASLESAIKRLFPGAEFKFVDVNDEEGKTLVEDLGIDIVPSYIFEGDSFMDAESMEENPALANAFEDLGDGYYKIIDSQTGASYYVSEEKRLETLEAMGITLDDGRPQMDFFVMSYCPYGNQAEEIIKEVYDVMKDHVDFNPRYIYYENYQGGGDSYCIDEDSTYCSMHGVQEANQNIRELCVMDEYGMDAWFDFAIEMNSECTYSNADSCWQDVAEGLGYDVDTISACEEEDAEEYAAEDMRLSELFKATGSPAIYIDGEAYMGSRNPAAMLSAVCEYLDEKPDACDVELDDTQTAAAGQC